MHARRGLGRRTFGSYVPSLPPRDPWKQPFPSDWWGNIAIGSGAALVPAGLSTPSTTKIKTDGINFSVDSADPLKTLTKSSFYYSGTGSLVSGVGGVTFSSQVHVSSTLSEDGRMNGICCFQDYLGNLWEVQPLIYDMANSDPTWHEPRAPFASVRGVDVRNYPVGGSHGGANLTAFGLTIRSWELDGTTNAIQHTVAVNVPGRMVYRSGADNPTGFRWPATNADSGWNTSSNNTYGGTVPDVKMGALLTTDLGYTNARIAAGTLTNSTAIKLTRTAEESGIVIADVTGTSDVFQFSVEKASEPDFLALPTIFSTEMMQTMLDLKVVTNNASATPGGGGTPRRAALPPLG